MAKESVPIAILSHVLCSVSLPLFENLSAGFVQSSKNVQGVWFYCVAFPPSNIRSGWSLVADVHPSQISLVRNGVPAADVAVKSIARISNAKFRPSVPNTKLKVGASKVATRPHVQRRQGNLGRVHPKCQHGKRQTICRECKGGSLCDHGKQRYWCILCGGKALCEHGKQKSKCLQCHGSGICKHRRLRTKCPDCKSFKTTL